MWELQGAKRAGSKCLGWSQVTQGAKSLPQLCGVGVLNTTAFCPESQEAGKLQGRKVSLMLIFKEIKLAVGTQCVGVSSDF